MSNYDLAELKLLKWQFGLSIAFIFTIVVSLSLTYNEILKYENKSPLYTSQNAYDIQVINRLLGTLIALAFLYINYIDKQLKEENNLDTSSANLQIDAGVLTLIATIIVLYVSITSNSQIENPEI